LVCLFLGLARSATIKIIPFGDSISGGASGQSCWRAKLWQKLQKDGFTNIDFVGSIREASCSGEYDPDTEGHSGFQIVNIVNDNQLPGWLSAAQPDIILMHLVTNDIVFGLGQGSSSMQDVQNAYTNCLTQMRSYKANIILIVAQIIPMDVGSFFPNAQRDITSLNNFIAQWAQQYSTTQSPITLVDQYTGFNAGSDTQDGMHPNDQGNEKMANKWLGSLEAAIKSLS
jgi:lysophospholipase L1-like esterase